jgi:ketosteroid isomerase-like protein
MPCSNPEVERQEVLAVMDQEVAAISTADVDAYLAILADDAAFMPPNASAKAGQELRVWLRNLIDGGLKGRDNEAQGKRTGTQPSECQ